MKLSTKDTDIFYRLIWSLLFYTNQKFPIIKNLKEPMLKNEKPEDIFNLHEKLFTDALTACFAVFEEIIIASGQSEKETRERAYAVVPQDKRAGVHVFRHGRK